MTYRECAAPDGRAEFAARSVYFLAGHAYCCELEEGAIILDLATGSYVGIQAEYLENLRSRVRNWPDQRVADQGARRATAKANEDLVATLLARGILTASPIAKPTCASPTPIEAFANRAIMAAGVGVSPLLHLSDFVLSLLTVSLRHHDKRLGSLIEWLTQRQHGLHRSHRRSTPEALKRLLASFLRLRVWFYTADRRCLFDSLVLAVFLTKNKIPCTLVIGVSTRPFQAHSWVQLGNIVLNDTAENIQSFTPILAVGSSGTGDTCFATS
jgi:hypothetical protein